VTLDERIEALTHNVERLAGRHDSLAHSVELLAGMQAKTEQTLRWAIRLGVREARNQRKRNLESAKKSLGLEQEMERLARALAAFLERSGNGRH
jgi:hypothetical protein